MQVESDRSLLIAFVSNNGWSVYNFRLDVIRSLMLAGHRVLVLCPEDAFVDKLRKEGCQYQPLHFDNRSISPLADFQFYLEAKKYYRQYRPNLVFHFVAKPNIYGTMAAAATGIQSIAVVTGLGYAFSQKNILYHMVKQLYRRALKGAREVWFLNNEDADFFTRNGITDIKKTRVLPGEGIDTEWFSPVAKSDDGDGDFCFLMASRLLKSKGIGVYADACRLLRKKGHRFKSILIGSVETHHPDAISNEQLARWEEEGLLRYEGFMDDVRPWLSRADCFVFPSTYNEGVPRSLLEAASMELPIVTSDSRGCHDVVKHLENGLLAKPGDPFDLALKMEEMMLMTPSVRMSMGNKGRELVKARFDISKIIAHYKQAVVSLGGHQ